MVAVALNSGDVSSDNGAASIRGHVSRHHVRRPLLCCRKTSASFGYKIQRKEVAKGEREEKQVGETETARGKTEEERGLDRKKERRQRGRKEDRRRKKN